MQLPFVLRKKKVTTGRGSSLNFEDVHSVHTTLAHNWRQQKSEPKHLLPPEHRRQNLALLNNPQTHREALVARFNADQARRTKRAKTERCSAWWDAVVNLPDPPSNPEEHEAWAAKLTPKIRRLGKEIERTTGLQLVDAVTHWDEGKLYEDGRVKYNGHAHLTFCRLQPDGKMLRFRKGDLQRLQTLVAYELDMRRGDHGTFATHLPPEAYREAMKARDREAETAQALASEQSRNKGLQLNLERLTNEHSAAEVELLKAQERMKELEASQMHESKPGALSAHETYLELRGAFKASGVASQAHYVALKQIYEGGNESALAAMHQKIGDDRGIFFELEHATGLDFDELRKGSTVAKTATEKQEGRCDPSF